MPTNKAFEELFRERFENLEETPPAFAWNKIQQDITPKKAPKAKPAAPKFTWLVPGAIITVISIALLVLLKYNKAIENQQAPSPKQYALEAEAKELSEPVTEIIPVTPVKEVSKTEKPAFQAYEAKPEKPANDFVKKRYLKGAEKSETTAAVPARKKLNATKVVYVVTVDPKSASVKEISTAVSDSSAAN